MSDKIKLDRLGNGITLVSLDNPPLNVITLEMTARLTEIFKDLEGDEDTRVVVITGTGTRAFCAGADIREFDSVRNDVINKKLKKENAAFQCVEDLSKPVIAAIQAIALGGGCELALACDIRILSDAAKIGLPEIKLGVFPGSGGIYRLPQIVGLQNALEMMYTGDVIDAAEAFRIGLASHVVSADRILAYALELAKKIAEGPRLGLAAIKKGVRKSLEISREEAVELNLALSDQVFKSDDCNEGVRAFFEKRKPNFK